MPDHLPEAPQIVTQACRLLWPGAWVRPAAMALGVNVRTMQRIGQAARAGQAFPLAPGMVAALARLVEPRDEALAARLVKLAGQE